MTGTGSEPLRFEADPFDPDPRPFQRYGRDQSHDHTLGEPHKHEHTSRFGPSALITPANAITAARLLTTPVLVVLVAVGGTGWVPFAVALVIGATDVMDGWVSRRQGATRSGAFLDPLADKVAVLSVLFALAARNQVAWWPVGLIAAREVAMSVYRSLMGRRGVSIPARLSAKLKAWVQGIAILLALTPPVAPHRIVIETGMWVAVAFTLVTGVQYMVDGARAARSAAARGSVTRHRRR